MSAVLYWEHASGRWGARMLRGAHLLSKCMLTEQAAGPVLMGLQQTLDRTHGCIPSALCHLC
jgi:hypothetical protein